MTNIPDNIKEMFINVVYNPESCILLSYYEKVEKYIFLYEINDNAQIMTCDKNGRKLGCAQVVSPEGIQILTDIQRKYYELLEKQQST